MAYEITSKLNAMNGRKYKPTDQIVIFMKNMRATEKYMT